VNVLKVFLRSLKQIANGRKPSSPSLTIIRLRELGLTTVIDIINQA
jgi:hypothetical protein